MDRSTVLICHDNGMIMSLHNFYLVNMIKSPSTYGKKGYEEYRKKEKMKKKTDPEKGPNTVVSYTKYAVSGESKEVPATTGLEQNQPKQKKSLKK